MIRPFSVIGFTIFLTLAIILPLGDKAAIVLLSAAVVAFVLFVMFERTRRNFIIPAVCLSICIASMLAVGANFVPHETEKNLDNSDRQIKGHIVALESKNYNRFYNVVETSEIDGVEYKIKLRISSKLPLEAEPYDEIEGKFHLYNLGSSSEDSRNYYLSQDVFVGAYQLNEAVIKPTDNRPVGYYILMLRKGIRDNISNYMPTQSGELAKALLIGDKSDLSDYIEKDFSAVGVSHLIAVSGMHLSIWCLFVLKLFESLGIKSRFASISALAFVLLFMAVAGFTYSVMRAGFMMLVMLVGNILSRRSDSLNSLGISVTILCFINPYCALNVGMQLSFSATLGIILGYQYFYTELDDLLYYIDNFRVRKAVEFFYRIIKSTFFACTFTLPVMITEFEKIPLLSLISNLLLSLPATVCMITSGLLAMTGFSYRLEFMSTILTSISQACSNFIINTVHFLAQLPFVSIRADYIEFYIWLAVTVVIISVCFVASRLGRAIKQRAVIIVCAAAFVFTCVFSAVYRRNNVEITVADVGNGTAVIVEKNGEAVLLGCGGDNFYAEANIEKAIDRIGVNSLKLLLVPRISKGESSLCDEIIKYCEPQYAVLGQTDSDMRYSFKYVEHDLISDATIKIWDDVSLDFRTDYNFSAAILHVGQRRIVINFNPSYKSQLSDFDRRGDVLIAGSRVPAGYNTGDYSFVVLSADYNSGNPQLQTLSGTNNNVMATMQQGNIRLTVTQTGNIYSERVK